MVPGAVCMPAHSGTMLLRQSINCACTNGYIHNRCFLLTCDQALVTGTASASEGLVLERLLVVLGGARVEAAGALLGPQQDASLVVTDFPAVLLQPIYSALPALQVSSCRRSCNVVQTVLSSACAHISTHPPCMICLP